MCVLPRSSMRFQQQLLHAQHVLGLGTQREASLLGQWRICSHTTWCREENNRAGLCPLIRSGSVWPRYVGRPLRRDMEERRMKEEAVWTSGGPWGRARGPGKSEECPLGRICLQRAGATEVSVRPSRNASD